MSAAYRGSSNSSSKTRLMALMALRCSSCLRRESGGIGARLYHRLHLTHYQHHHHHQTPSYRARYLSTATFSPLSSSSYPPIPGKHSGDNEKEEYRQKGIHKFRPTSSAELDAILSDFRSTLFLYAHLPRAQRAAIAKPSFKALRQQVLDEQQQQEQQQQAQQAQEQAQEQEQGQGHGQAASQSQLSPEQKRQQQQLQQQAQDPSSPLAGAFYELAGETFLLPTYAQLQTACPMRRSYRAMLALMREPRDWDAVLPGFLREVRYAGRELAQDLLEKTVRRANAVSLESAAAAHAARAKSASADADAATTTTTTTTTTTDNDNNTTISTDGSGARRAREPHTVVLACAHDAARTGFVLQHVPIVRELLWGAVQRAHARAWGRHATERALAFAEDVVRLLDSPLHCGQRGSRRRRRLQRREHPGSATGKRAAAPRAGSQDEVEQGREEYGAAQDLEEAAAQNGQEEVASEATEATEAQETMLLDNGDADNLPTDPRVQPDIIGPLLLLAAVRDSMYGGGRDADGKVRMYAERLRANWVHAQTDALQRAASWDERGVEAGPSSSSLFSAFSSSSSSPPSSSTSSPSPSQQHDAQHVTRRRAFWEANSELVRWMPVWKGMELALAILTAEQTATDTAKAAAGNTDAAASSYVDSAEFDKERREALTAWLRATAPALREALDNARSVLETFVSRPAGVSNNNGDHDDGSSGSSSSNNGRRKGLVAYDILASL